MKKKLERPSFFAPIWAWFRQGGKEFGQALPATKESIQVVEEPGTLGNPTQQMVTEQSGTLGGFSRELDKYSSRARDRGEPEQVMER
jgi:hypothetical protein